MDKKEQLIGLLEDVNLNDSDLLFDIWNAMADADRKDDCVDYDYLANKIIVDTEKFVDVFRRNGCFSIFENYFKDVLA